jgi:hypothetical protein
MGRAMGEVGRVLPSLRDMPMLAQEQEKKIFALYVGMFLVIFHMKK